MATSSGAWARYAGAVVAIGVLLGACGRGTPRSRDMRVDVVTPAAAGSGLQGTWPAKPKPKPKPAAPAPKPKPVVDPSTGLTISGPLGPPWPTAIPVAAAVVPRVALFQSPGVPVPAGTVLPHPTVEGLPLVFLVRSEQPDWVQVQVAVRPNGATGWVRKSDVAIHTVPNHVVIERGGKRLTVYHGDVQVFQVPVAPGLASSPTPLGSFFVDGIAKPPNPNGPYGLYQVSFTGFSEVYQHFGSGNGQVAMHGTNRPELIGKPASHGCVRLTNEAISAMVLLAPPGTPVDVVA